MRQLFVSLLIVAGLLAVVQAGWTAAYSARQIGCIEADPNEPQPEFAFVGIDQEPNEPQPECVFGGIDQGPNEPQPEFALIGGVEEEPEEPGPEPEFCRSQGR